MEQILIICGVITAVGGAAAVINKIIFQPLQEIIKSLEKLDKIEQGQVVLMESTASLMEHIITGNHMEKLKTEYDNLISFNIKKG